MSQEQRRGVLVHDLGDGLTVVKASAKFDRRHRLYVAQDGDQILREWWPADEAARREALSFLDGYRMAKSVWGGGR